MELQRRRLVLALAGAPLLVGLGQARAAEPSLTRSDAQRVLAEWEALGWHWTGSDTEHNSADWMAKLSSAMGARSAVLTYPFDRTDVERCTVRIGERSVPGLPMFDGGATSAAGITGKLGKFGDDADIALIEASPNGEYEPAFVAARKDTRYAALVVVTKGGIPGLAPINAPEHKQGKLPVIQVSSEHLEWLAAAAVAHDEIQVVARFVRRETVARNVVASILGTQPQLPPLVVATPRSGWGPCVGERGGGILAWLEVARILAASQPPRTVIFIASSGHELGHLGMDAFEAMNPTLVKSAYVWLHLGANLGARSSKLILQGSTEEWLQMAQERLKLENAKVETVVPIATKPYGEARNVFDGGGRYVSLLATPGPAFHHPLDMLPAAVDLDQVTAIARAVSRIATELAWA